MLENVFFILLCNLIIITAFLVISTRNPVISMLYLILVFLQASLIFLCLGAEFLFILFLVVYVGAIAILFLFVIMLLNLRVVENYNMFYNYMPIGLFIGIFFAFFLVRFIIIDFSWSFFDSFTLVDNYVDTWVSLLFFKSNLNSIGEIFYNYYHSYFILSGVILLVALLGVVYLTLDFPAKVLSTPLYNYRRMPYDSIFDMEYN